MTTQNIALFKGITAKMGFLNERQRVISQNMANSDTPGYRPHDLKEVDFGRVLQRATGENRVRTETTNAMHMPSPNEIDDPKNRKQKVMYEIAPVGNSVSVEEQMVKATQTRMDYDLMTSLYQKNVGMIRTAIGSGR